MAPAIESGSPQAAAMTWVEAVMDRGDLAAAWPATDPQLRLVLAQDWVWNHRHDPAIGHDADWDAIAHGLAAVPPEDPLWDRFASDVVAVWQRTWKDFSADTWGVWDQPEVLDLDLEMVTFVERDSAAHPAESSELPMRPGHSTFTRRFAMRHTPQGWQVASVNGDQLFEPGWPPRLGRPAGQA
jgi:hypothetical protein